MGGWFFTSFFIIFPPFQFRTLHALRYAALLSDAAVVVALGMIFGSLAYYGREPGVSVEWSVPKNDFLDGYNK